MTGEERKALHRLVGAAIGAHDSAELAGNHTARQIIYALAHGALEDLGEQALVDVAKRHDEIATAIAQLRHRAKESQRAIDKLQPGDDTTELHRAAQEITDTGRSLRDQANELRRSLPRRYGDPLELDRTYPA